MQPIDVLRAELNFTRAQVAMLQREVEVRDQRAREQEELQVLARAELQHRARNTVALLRSTFRRTVETAESLEQVELHFSGRLDVLARHQLPRFENANVTAELESLIREELQDFEFGDAPGITIEGHPVAISSGHVQALALAIHELVTNALKFGALAGSGPKLKVSWSVTGQRLNVLWEETGVSVVSASPLGRGFGREFIEEGLPYQIGATTSFEPKPGGIIWRLELPLETGGSRDD